ncbi:MAG: biosynthetic-type acetolactate synthase large subunit [Clostridiales Family XIII bacterium]|jgi:acetolactate synthase-1/2/3 large subunit|nr:biosynthetic-type acetolactate synthase large subunit [Clostridiales Family XIII bacterium]
MNGAQAIIKSLQKEGVTHIFGYPGATIAPLYDKLPGTGIRHILVRHEQHAGHAAGGYARIAGRPGVCAVTSGPGATNLLTALATAYMDSVPIVAVTGQVDSSLLGRDVFQEADITGAAEPFTKYSYLVKNAQDLPRIVKEAFHIASTGRPGPVLIDVPVDVQLTETKFDFTGNVDIRGYKPTVKGHAGQIKRVLRTLEHAQCPLICVGGGIFAAKAQDMFAQFVETVNIPVVSTLMGIGALPTAHPLYMGQVGMHGKSTANDAISEADVLLLIGARVSDRAVLLPDKVRRKTKIIHIDIDPAEIGKNLDTFLPVVGDVKTVMEQILSYRPKRKGDEWVGFLTEKKNGKSPDHGGRADGVNPKAFVSKLSKALPDRFIYCADVGQNQLWSAGNIDIRAGGRFLTTGGMGTMGYAIAAAAGAKIASEVSDAAERFVIAVCGDGSFQMSMMELATLMQHGIDVKVVVMVNGKLGLVREIQTDVYGDRQVAVDLAGSPDPVVIARAYGIDGAAADTMEQAEAGIRELLSHKGPYLLAVRVGERESSL